MDPDCHEKYTKLICRGEGGFRLRFLKIPTPDCYEKYTKLICRGGGLY